MGLRTQAFRVENIGARARASTYHYLNDVRSDSGYEIGSGRGYRGGVNPRLQGPWANRYRARRKAQRRRQPEYGRITKPDRYT